MYLYGYHNLTKIINTPKGKELIACAKNRYASKFSAPITALPYDKFKQILIDGERKEYESYYYERRERLLFLQILCVADDGYLNELENTLSAILDEYTWVLPAHCITKDGKFDYTVIDLVAAETGAFLAETAFVLKDKLSPDVVDRIKAEVERKIVKNYESRQFLFDNCTHNWAAVCSGGIGRAYLYLFPERFSNVKDRIFCAMQNYIKGLDDEGVSSEGVSYWEYGFGSFCTFFDVYVQLTGDCPEILRRPKVIKTLEYFKNANMGKDVYLPFADGGKKKTYFNPVLIYPVKNLFKDAFELPFMDVCSFRYPLYRVGGFCMIYGLNAYGDDDDKRVKKGTVFYGNSQIFIHKNENYSFAVKCGHNAEHHNHNDVGAFQIVRDGKRLIADLGMGEYTWAYHNDHTETGRYGKEIFVCGSWSHSVPIVDGRPQVSGMKRKGVILQEGPRFISMDIAGAYDVGIEKLQATYSVDDDGVRVRYSCKGIKEQIVFRFVSDYLPVVKDGVTVENMKIINDLSIVPTVDAVEYAGAQSNKEKQVNKQTAFVIDYRVAGKEQTDVEFKFIFVNS